MQSEDETRTAGVGHKSETGAPTDEECMTKATETRTAEVGHKSERDAPIDEECVKKATDTRLQSAFGVAVWCRKRSVEREKIGMHEAKFLTC
jgi:hypothetical protein